MAVQWLRVYASSARGVGLIPGQGNNIPHTVHMTKKKKKDYSERKVLKRLRPTAPDPDAALFQKVLRKVPPLSGRQCTHPGRRKSSACSGWQLSPKTCRTGASSKNRRPRAGPPGQCHTGVLGQKGDVNKINGVAESDTTE